MSTIISNLADISQESEASPKVSVLVKTYNHASYIGQTIESVLTQSFQDFEIVITDDGSTDGTQDVLSRFNDPRIHVSCFAVNQGISSAMNATIARARGRYLATLNSDDWALPGRLQRQVDFLDQNPQISLLFGLPRLIDEGGSPIMPDATFAPAFNRPLSFCDFSRRTWLREFFFRGNCVCAPTAMVRREVYETAGRYDPRFTNLQDLDMWVRALIAGYEIGWLPEPFTAFRIRADNGNMSAPRTDTVLRLGFETAKILAHFTKLNADDFENFFGQEAARTTNFSDPVGLRVAELALRNLSTPYQRLALEAYYDTAREPHEFRRLATLSGTIDVSNDLHVKELSRLLDERDAQIADLKKTEAEYVYHLERMKSLLFWKIHEFFYSLTRLGPRLLRFIRSPARSSGPDKMVKAPSKMKTAAQNAATEYVPLFKGKPPTQKLAKLICFYLPQFHPIPENDAWWGEGFTEWTNVRAAHPKFEGHYQPRIPGELGYYSLLDPEVQRRQIELAKLYGIEGFCFYFYWFGGKRLLERPIENYLKDPTLDLPFCLCWANENWTRRWDGLDRQILMSQHHSPSDDIAFIAHVAQYMCDPRYIRVNGKPLLIVYRPTLLPSAIETARRWRCWCCDNGVGDIYLAYTQSFEKIDPAKYEFDAAIEFPPNKIPKVNITDAFLPQMEDDSSSVYDWEDFLRRSENYERPMYRLFRSVCPSWDDTPRRKKYATIYVNNSPALYQRWLSNATADTRKRFTQADERLVFVNAWNEWGEGAYLEPDARYGYAYLQATRDAICDVEAQDDPPILVVTHDCRPNGAQLLTLEIARQLKFDGFDVAILALDGGKLQDEFASIGSLINARQADGAALQNFLDRLIARGARHAIISTVVSGSIVSELKDLGFRVLSLVHELPGVIRVLGQESNAEAIARLADKVVFPAEMVREQFEKIAAVESGKVIVRHQGLLRKNPYKDRKAEAYRAICEKHQLPAGTKIVFSVAYGDLRKGPDLFLEIAARVASERPDVTFIWVGDRTPEMEQKIAQAVRAGEISARVLFIGFEREPFAYYAAASVYALTSREDPFPNVVLESAEVDVPVVAFEGTTGAANFILERGGRLASHLDTGDFARHVCELLDSQTRTALEVPSLRQYTLDLLHYLDRFPRVSVIVPNYNYGRYLPRRLDSIFHQAFPLYEVLVLDDASTDESVGITRTYFQETKSEGRLLTNEGNSGSVFRQWQRGVACCAGDLVWIAEADDLSEESFLRELAPAFEDPDVVLAFSQSKQIDGDGNILAENYLEYTRDISDRWRADYVNDGSDEIAESLSIKNTIPNVSAVLFRREALARAFQTIGDDLFRYRVAGDWLVYLHVLLQGKAFYNCKSLNLHRRHSDSVTKGLDANNHLREVCQLQEIARSLSRPSAESLENAKSYIGRLKKHFALSEGSQQ